ncbi:MAG: Zn-dependent hydrolase [Bacteroidales bacterium]
MKFKSILFILASMIIISSCSDSKHAKYQALADQYAKFELKTQVPLTQNEEEVIALLEKASDCMEDLYWHVAFGNKDILFKDVTDTSLIKYLHINYGPWDRLNDNKPFIELYGPKPLGANFYPADMTDEEFQSIKDPNKTSWYTCIVRNKDKSLSVKWFHEMFPKKVEEAASYIEQAAEITTDITFKKYLNLRATAIRTDNYLESDMEWMEMKDNKLDIVIGPIEKYEDALYGYKASYSGQILVKDKAESNRYSKFAAQFQRLQNAIPLPAEYNTEKANTNPDINIYDVIYYAGDCNSASKNIAISLPNDPRVSNIKGTRKLQLRNVMKAKFDNIVIPISKLVIDPAQQKHIKFDAFFQNTMFHEVSHGLGVNYTITKPRMECTDALGNSYTAIEEGKADILGLFCVTKMGEWGYLGEKDILDNYVTFIAGIFRSARFGVAEAHGQTNMMQFSQFLESGAIVRNETGKYYTVNLEKMKAEITRIASQYIKIEADGNKILADELLKERGLLTPTLSSDLDRIAKANIPKDIYFD